MLVNIISNSICCFWNIRSRYTFMNMRILNTAGAHLSGTCFRHRFFQNLVLVWVKRCVLLMHLILETFYMHSTVLPVNYFRIRGNHIVKKALWNSSFPYKHFGFWSDLTIKIWIYNILYLVVRILVGCVNSSIIWLLFSKNLISIRSCKVFQVFLFII